MRTDDGSIIYDCLNGKPEAFGMLIDKYKEGIYAFVYSEIRNFQDAQDVTQEVFIQAYQDLRNLKRWESFSFWLYRIARRKCISWFRNRAKRVDHDFIDDQEQSKIDIPSLKSYQDDRLAESVQEALDTLPNIYREALILHYFGGMKSEEIAESLGISPTAIRMRLSRAREQLKEEMVAMMDMAFDRQRLKAGFTFRIVEAIKQVKIQSISQPKGLPWGLSLGAGIIFAVLMLGQHIIISLPDIAMGLPLPSDTKILKVGEIPVDAVKISTITSIADKGDGKGLAPDPKGQENAFFMAPQGEGGWVKKADMPFKNTFSPACEFGGKIYLFRFFGGLRVYDPETDKWTEKNTKEAVCDGSAVVFGDKIYVLVETGFIYKYDPNLDTWVKKSKSQFPKRASSLVNTNGKIYAIGGATLENSVFSIVEEYDPSNDTWTRKNDLPSNRAWGSACAINDKIYYFGGVDNVNAFSTTFEYDPKNDEWTKGLNMPTARYSLATVAYRDKIIALGGNTALDIFNRDGISTVEEFDPGFISKSVDPNVKLPHTWGTLKAK